MWVTVSFGTEVRDPDRAHHGLREGGAQSLIMAAEEQVVRFAFVGCGCIASVHLEALRGCSILGQLRAAVDPRRERAAELVGKLPPDAQCQVRTRSLPS